jgi:thiamine-phosphate pyrophosphorylase
MSVPRLLVLTDRHAAQAAGRDLVATVAAAVAAGPVTVLLRERDLPRPRRMALGRELADVVRHADARLFVAGDVALARELGAHGVHLAARDPAVAADGLVVGRSCHDHAELDRARAEAADYATVSPVAATPSKPGYGPPLGADGLRALAAAAGPLPVLALGGVTPATAGRWLAAGAHGLAVMGAVMAADDPGAVVRRLLEVLAVEVRA